MILQWCVFSNNKFNYFSYLSPWLWIEYSFAQINISIIGVFLKTNRMYFVHLWWVIIWNLSDYFSKLEKKRRRHLTVYDFWSIWLFSFHGYHFFTHHTSKGSNIRFYISCTVLYSLILYNSLIMLTNQMPILLLKHIIFLNIHDIF